MQRPETSRPVGGEPRYRGVRKRAWGKWVCEIRLPNSRERIWLGSYDAPEKAARAFDAAMFCLRGRKGRFNFPHDIPDIPRARSLTPPEIQAAAARFAHEASVAAAPAPQPPQAAEDCGRSAAGSPARSNSGFSSDEAFTADSDGVDWSFLDLLYPVEPSSGGVAAGCLDFDIGFPAINDFFPGEFFPPPPPEPPILDYDDSGLFFGSQQSFLWNF